MRKISVVVVTLCGALTGCDIPPSELEVTRQQYMTAQKCVPVLYELRIKSEQFCGRYSACKDIEVEYYDVKYECANGKTLTIQMKKE